MKFLLFFIFSLIALSGCSSEDEGVSLDSDLNGDGVADQFFEYDGRFSYTLVDSNFDGSIDQSHKYNDSDEIVASFYDDDFDGFLETYSLYNNGNPAFHFVDVDLDGVGELFFFYENGVLTRAVEYVEGGRIKSVKFKFGFPVTENIIKVGSTEYQYFREVMDKYWGDFNWSQLRNEK
jgi:antitoxin component YwqK of YwqJK toxin-antitoxin module